MASPSDPDAEPTRERTSDEGNEDAEDRESSLDKENVEVADDDDSPPRETTVKISTGQDLTVVLGDKDVKLKIQHDALGRIRVFGLGTGDLMPMMNQRPGSFDVVLSKRRFGNKFDFFGLPREIRNIIYCIIFRLKTFPTESTQSAPMEVKLNPGRTENFHYKRPLHPVRFLARLNKTAPSAGCGIAFINRQSLHETKIALLRSMQYHVCGDRQAYSLLKSMGVYGQIHWMQPLVLNLNKWETNAECASLWREIIFKVGGGTFPSRFRGLIIMTEENGWNKNFDIMRSPIGQVLAHRDEWRCISCSVIQPPLGDEEVKFVGGQFFFALKPERWVRSDLNQGGEALLAKRVYEAMKRAVENRLGRR